jgi:hypothetical protein
MELTLMGTSFSYLTHLIFSHHSSQRSNLHLIDWSFVLLDHHNQFHHVRCGTARGDCISQLTTRPSGRKISIIDRIDDDAYWKQSSGSVLMDISQLLDIPSYELKKNSYQFH